MFMHCCEQAKQVSKQNKSDCQQHLQGIQSREEDAVKADINLMPKISAAWFNLYLASWSGCMRVDIEGTGELCKNKAATRSQMERCHQHAIEACGST
jgi:hypothetical protein